MKWWVVQWVAAGCVALAFGGGVVRHARGADAEDKAAKKALKAKEKVEAGKTTLTTPGEILAKIKAPDGFKVTVFASPPQVGYPTGVAAGVTDEVFVAIDTQGSLGHSPDGGKVMRLIDTDGDGRADKFTDFAKMDHPRGVVYDGVKLYVLHPPFLTAYWDEDGDGVAEKSQDLLTGISTEELVKSRGADHTTNGITLGIDGWIYIAVGDFGFTKATGTDGKSLQHHGGGVARVRPDGTELEMVSINQRNIYGVGVDPLLNIYTRDNTNDGDGWDERFHHIVPLANVGYPMLFKHFKEDTLPWLADMGGGSPCGTTYVDEPGLPEPYGRSLYCCDWGRSIVYSQPLEANGATFKVKQEQFLAIPRPTDMNVDGQGRMFVTSWMNGGFSYSGPNVGFVARVTGGETPPPVLDLKKANLGQLGRYLGTDSHVARLAAQRELLRRAPDSRVAGVLANIAGSADRRLAVRVAALFTLKQMEGAKANAAIVKLVGDDAMREFALRALADRKTQLEGVPADVFVSALNDNNPRVRLQAINGLVRMGHKDAAEKILGLVDDKDIVVAHVATRALIVMHADDVCIAALEHAGSPTFNGALNVLKWFHDPKVVTAILDRLGKEKDSAVRQPLLTALCRLYFDEAEWDGKWWGTRPNSVGPYYKGVTWGESDRIGKVLSASLAQAEPEMAKFLLVEFGRHHLDSGETMKQIVAIAQRNPAFKATAVELLGGKQNMGAESAGFLEAVAMSPKEDAATRVKAVRGLRTATGQDALDATVRVLGSTGGDNGLPEVQHLREEFVRDGNQAQNVQYFAKLANGDDPNKREVAYAVLALAAKNTRIAEKNRGPAVTAIEKAWAKPATAASLLRAIGQVKADAYAAVVQAHLSDKDAVVKEAAAYADARLKANAVASGGGKTIGEMEYEEAAPLAMKEKGDPKLGAQMFLRQGCVACHTTSPTETPKGPYLGDVATRYPRAELIESILKPNAKIAQGFTTHWFKLKGSKERKEGFIVTEGDEIHMRDVTGTETVIPVGEIAERGKLETSIMPEGIAGNMTVHEFGSLLAYLETLRGAK